MLSTKKILAGHNMVLGGPRVARGPDFAQACPRLINTNIAQNKVTLICQKFLVSKTIFTSKNIIRVKVGYNELGYNEHRL